MITIKIKGILATIEDDRWKCEDKLLKTILSTFSRSRFWRYLPYPDLLVAREVIKTLGGRIIKIDDYGFVEGRIY